MDSYDFLNKQIYRKKRETAIDRMLSKPKALRRVAYLDTKEALDTISYLKRGYGPANLWAINRNPAELAHLSMKLDSLGLPRVNTVGLDFEDALDRRVPDVDVIDFDGMGCLSDRLTVMIARIVAKRPKAIYGVTMLGGRESEYRELIDICRTMVPAVQRTSFGTRMNPNHSARLYALMAAFAAPPPEEDDKYHCSIQVMDLKWDVYVSTSGQPMIWCICKVEPHRYFTHKEKMKIWKDTKGMAMMWENTAQ